MHLKITAPEKTIFEWEVLEVTVPTQAGTIGILPKHIPMTTIVKWGICKFKTLDSIENILSEDGANVISIWDWVLYTDGDQILMTVYSANTNVDLSEDELNNMKEELTKQIKQLKAKGNIEELEWALIHMNKIMADLKLVNIKKRQNIKTM